jgi:hypothetical protein
VKKKKDKFAYSEADYFVMHAVSVAMDCVLDGRATMEQFLMDTSVLCQQANFRLVVTRWPASIGELVSGRAWYVDLDFVFRSAPFTVSLVEQKTPPAWMVGQR